MVSSWDAALQDRVPFISTTITKVWDRLRKVAGLPHLRLYDLRHQFTHSLINNGGTLYEVQQILGHSDSKVTMWCTYLFTKALRETANNAAVKIGA
ncbi:MAG: tyrosine-type recombinase/integrase [Nitrosomonas sp.]|nr:tyrosine-type recombinase/integrase [Nitrosomonas sp.]